MERKLNKIGVLTSGGDAPGMNAAIRAVVRTANYNNIEIYGIRRGYQGLIDDDIFLMDNQSVANIIQRGGTILKTARCKEFYTSEGRKKAHDTLVAHGINGLVIIGGNGSFAGAVNLSNEFPDIQCVGIAGTIDKDISGTDYTVGFDTAVNTAVSAIDKIRDTMEAHDRIFVIEVMGRNAGYIALHSGISTGASDILLPEQKTDIDEVINRLKEKERRKKLVNLVVVAEGDDFGGGEKVIKKLKEDMPNSDIKLTVLGHIQRGGAPSSLDRVIASRMGYHAVESLQLNRGNVFVGILNNRMNYMPLDNAIKIKSDIDQEWIDIVHILAS